MTAPSNSGAPLAPPLAHQGHAPAPAAGPKLSVSWTGVLMAVGAIVAAVGTFLPFEKIVQFKDGSAVGTFQATGIGTKTLTGEVIQGLAPASAGKTLSTMAVLVLVLGVLVLSQKGRLWVSIVGLVASLLALAMGLASLAAPASDGKDLRAAGYSAHALVKGGATIATVGAGLMVLGSLLALIIRRRRAV